MTSDALDYITIRGFKSIASLERLRLRPINILIGPNGSGKSNFVGAFSFLRAIQQGRLQEYVTTAGGAEKVLHFGSKTTKEASFVLSFADGTNQYELKLAPTDDDSLFPVEEAVSFWDKAHPEPLSKSLPPGEKRREAGISQSGHKGIAHWVRYRLGRWRVYHLHDTSSSSPMRKTARVNDNDFLRPDGSNLAPFLFYLREEHREHYDLVVRTIQQVAPFFEDFRLKPLKLKRDDIKLEWRHKSSDQYFEASALSDGTLRFIALATLFLQPRPYRPETILVDEPELGLHPYAIGLLAALIRQASIESQVIVSTQSSLLLDHFQPEDVLVADRMEGGTVITRPDAKQLAGWLEEYSLGQLWEKNELGGRPARG
jgi:predicted ATPase